MPLDDARSTPQNRALVTSGNFGIAAAFRLRLGGGVALRLRSVRLSVSAPLFPLADRRPKPGQKLNDVISQIEIKILMTLPMGIIFYAVLNGKHFHQEPKNCFEF
jgi:hypothetical protein